MHRPSMNETFQWSNQTQMTMGKIQILLFFQKKFKQFFLNKLI